MEFIETSVFTKQVTELLTERDYQALQHDLIVNPKAGSVIKNSGGIRKIRCGVSGRGKRGGIRVIYYYVDARGRFYMLVVYRKNECTDLSANEIKILRKMTRDLI